jgi:sulfur-carrier protein
MKVHVDLYANLKKFSSDGLGRLDLDLPADATVQAVIEQLRIPPAVRAVILVNGRRGAADTQLSDGDRLTLFPPMEGG